jgi:hypothetical protein
LFLNLYLFSPVYSSFAKKKKKKKQLIAVATRIYERILHVCAGIGSNHANNHDSHGDHQMEDPQLSARRKELKYLRCFLFLVHAAYETLTDQALVLVHCVHACQAGSILEEYPDVPCSGSTYKGFFAVAIIILVAVSVGFPLGMFIYLTKHRARHHETEFLARWGLFYDHYKPSVYWWQIQEYARRLLLLLGFVFIHDHHTKAYFVAIVCLFILIIHVLLLPFEHGVDNFVEAVSLTVLTYAAFATAAETSDSFLTILVYVTLAFLFMLTFLELFVKYFHRPIKSIYKKLRRRGGNSVNPSASTSQESSMITLQPMSSSSFSATNSPQDSHGAEAPASASAPSASTALGGADSEA